MAEQTVELAPSESKVISFEATPAEARTYQVSVDGLTGSFRALAPVPVTEILRPNGPGDYTNLAAYPKYGEGTIANWAAVARKTPGHGAGPYVYTKKVAGRTSGKQEKDAYNLQDIAIPSGSTINSVTVYFDIGANDTHNRAQPFLRLGSQETAGSKISPPLGWSSYSQVLARPGGGSWVVSDINKLQVCIGLTGYSIWACLCDQIYVAVNYTL